MNFLLTGIIFSSIIITNCQEEIIPPDYETFIDSRDGEIYKYVKIGNQFWMSENLRFNPDSGNFWAYNNNDTDVITYGYLYGWETATKACPNGWHLPSEAEWTELQDFLGGEQAAGEKMKVAGTSYWNTSNKDVTNSSGFSALPCGYFDGYDVFDGRGNITYFWSSEPRLNIWWLSGHSKFLHHSWIEIYQASASVRCVRD